MGFEQNTFLELELEKAAQTNMLMLRFPIRILNFLGDLIYIITRHIVKQIIVNYTRETIITTKIITTPLIPKTIFIIK